MENFVDVTFVKLTGKKDEVIYETIKKKLKIWNVNNSKILI